MWAAGEELIGTPAPEFEVAQWVQSEPLTVSGLHGSVVLIRFWTEACPFCSASFLLDRRGIIRFVHEGGRYDPDDEDALEDAITTWLARIG